MGNEMLELRRTAYKAVKEACKWMIDMRNSAPLEGLGPWSDMFVNYKQGTMNTCEGLTTMFVVDEYNQKEDLPIPILDQNILISDVKWLASQVEKEGYRGTPYIGYDTVEHFTDAVSYGLTVFLGARGMVKGTIKEHVEKQILNATNLLLSNKVEVDGTYGWSWMGSEEMAKRGVNYPPQTYFTYSALISLCDVLNEADDIIADIKEDILNTIQGGKDFLLKYNREDDGWIAFKPTDVLSPEGYNEYKPQPDILATSYAILTLSYIKNNVRNIKFEKEEEKIIFDAVNLMKEPIKTKTDKIFKYRTYYILDSSNKEENYYEGCAPYTFLNAFVEYYDAYPENKTEEDEKILNDLVQEILTKLWGQEGAGFRHIRSSDPNSEENIVVMYATSAAIQALLGFGVERPPVVSIKDIINEELEDSKKRILERLIESGIGLEMAVEKNEEIITKDVMESLDQPYAQMYTIVTVNLPTTELTKWVTDGRNANIEKFLELISKNYNEDNSRSFKEKITKFETGYSTVLFDPQKNAIASLKKLTDDEISNEKIRKAKIKDALKMLDQDVEKFIKNKVIT